MSSHREAPAISQDPVADNTDTYAFVSPDDPDTVTIISNYLPLEAPFGGPNFFEFGDDVRYEIHIDNDADGAPEITYEFLFQTKVRNPDTFLYNTGPIDATGQPELEPAPVLHGHAREERPPARAGERPGLPAVQHRAGLDPELRRRWRRLRSTRSPAATPCSPGSGSRASTSTSARCSTSAICARSRTCTSGAMAAAHGVNATHDFSVHSIALKIPKHELTNDGSNPHDPMAAKSVIGVWTAASRRRAVVRHAGTGSVHEAGPWVQVSRLGNPLFNEVIVPLGDKDRWNALPAQDDAQFLHYVEHPELAALLPVLYPGVFPNLAKLTAPRADLAAILMTGIPAGIVPGFQNFTGSHPGRSAPSQHGDRARAARIAEAARAGRRRPRGVPERAPRVRRRGHGGAAGDRRRHLSRWSNKSYTPDAAAALVTDGLGPGSTRYLPHFPYLGTPKSGYQTKPLAA